MTIVDDTLTHGEGRHNGASTATVAAQQVAPAVINETGALTRSDTAAASAAVSPPELAAVLDTAEPEHEKMRRHALRFFWGWLLFATVVSIGGNVIHAWMTAPEAHLKLLAAIGAAVPPSVLLGSSHSVALLIKTRRRGYRVVDSLVLGAGLLLTVGVAACAFAMSFFSLRDLMVTLGMSADTAWLWPIAVDLSLICSTLALLTLTSPGRGPVPEHTSTPTVLPAAAAPSWPTSPSERRLRWESVAAVVQEHNGDVRKIADLSIHDLADILESLYDKNESQRAICDSTKLHHREIRRIKETADDVLNRTTVPVTPGSTTTITEREVP